MSETQDGDGSEAELYKQEQVLRDLLINQGMTGREVAEELGVNPSTISRYARKYGIGHNIPDTDVEIPDVEKPYTDADLMERLYVEEEMSTTDISNILECSSVTISIRL